jgi:hypothetical protein
VTNEIITKKEHTKMKTITKTMTVLLALSASAWMLSAQDEPTNPPGGGQRPPRRERPGGGGPNQGGPNQGGPEGQRPPRPPLVAALDANDDGVIDETEIANASAALKKLDKNGDGKLTMDELRPPRPQGGGDFGGPRGPQGRRPGGPRPPHGPEGDAPQQPPAEN